MYGFYFATSELKDAQPASQRQGVLAKAFSDPLTFGNADILCLMEWDQYHLEQTLKTQGWEWINPRTPSARWGTTIAYKRDKFDLEASDVGYVSPAERGLASIMSELLTTP